MSEKGIRQLKKEKTRQEILAAAKELFQEKGYDTTTLREIAARSGISAGAVFVHFKDKLALFVETMKDMIDLELNKAMAAFPHDADIRTQLMHIPTHFYRYYARDPRLVRQLLKETLLFLDVQVSEPIRRQYEEHMGFIANVMEQAKAKGEIHPDVVSLTAAVAYASYYITVLMDMLKDDRPDVKLAIATMESLIDQLIRGIGTGRGP